MSCSPKFLLAKKYNIGSQIERFHKTRFDEILIVGKLDPNWLVWFEEMEIIPVFSSETLVKGSVEDQVQLFGILIKIRDLGLSLLHLKSSEYIHHDGSSNHYRRELEKYKQTSTVGLRFHLLVTSKNC
jgi:hypothetical protein